MSEENAKAGNSQKNRQNPADHLAPYKFKPGQSGNLSGRPKRKPVTELYEDILSEPANIEILRESIIKTLSRGQMAMVLLLREIAERIEGKVTQPIEAEVTVNLADAIAEARKRVGRCAHLIKES
jgi:hypothetical protein